MAIKKTAFETPAKTSLFNNPLNEDKFAEEIRKVAYQIYEKRGCMPGNDMSNWLEAEKIVKRKIKGGL